MNEALGILETTGFTPAMVALDLMEKAAQIRVVQAELNDFLGVCLKIAGSPADVAAALEAGRAAAERMGGRPVVAQIHRPDPRAWPAILSKPEVSPLIQQPVVMNPPDSNSPDLPAGPAPRKKNAPAKKDLQMAESTSFALGFIETQGFTAVFEAIDSACKAANVEVVGKEKLGGGYITVVVKGDVAAVKAAVEAGQAKVAGLGKLIAAHVIARPSAAALTLLPK